MLKSQGISIDHSILKPLPNKSHAPKQNLCFKGGYLEISIGKRDEREREPRERNPGYQWQIVTKKKPRNKPGQALRTCFVNFLPLQISNTEIARIFKVHGRIDHVYIPMINNQKNHKSAFVQFMHPQSLITATRDENGRRIDSHRITVHPAKYDKNLPHLHHHPASYLPPPPKITSKKPNSTHQNNSLRDFRSYKEVASPSPKNRPPVPSKPQINPGIPTSHTFPFENHPSPPLENLTSPNLSSLRIMSSRVLGEDTETIRQSLGSIEIEGDYVAAIKGKRCDDQEEMLKRSAIAISLGSQSSSMIMDNIIAQGVNCFSIKPMGGMMHLIVFDSFEDKKSIMESKWLEQWFITVRNVNDHSATLWRETWLKIYGMPITAWGYENFYNVGCIFGRVISVNYKEFDCAYVLVITDCLFEINGKIAMEIDKSEFPIFVSENKGQWELPKSCNPPIIKPAIVKIPSDNDDDMNHPLTAKDDDELRIQKVSRGDGEHLIPNNDSSRVLSQNNIEQPTTPPFHKSSPSQKTTFHPPDTSNNYCRSLSNTPNTPPTHPITLYNMMGLDNQPPKFQPSNKKDGPQKILFPKSPVSKQAQYLLPVSPNPKPTPCSSQVKNTFPIYNKFGALSRKPKTASSSSVTMDSSTCSGPIFPPGFEDNIPPPIKLAQLRKRKKKLEKKRKHRITSSSGLKIVPSVNQVCNMGSVMVEDIIKMADLLGLSFNGPTDELRHRIQLILKGQEKDWAAHQL